MSTVVHIGMHKTGSTAIQSALHKHHSELARQGFYYPTQETKWDGHHPLAWAMGVNHPSRSPTFDLGRTLESYFRKAAGKVLVLSSEDFESVPPAAVADFLSTLQEQGDVEVVCYFRHPADWVESAFKWHAMKEPNRFKGVDEYLAEGRIKAWLNYLAKAEKWSQNGVRFTPRLYSSDVVGDFLSVLGAGLKAEIDRENVSIRSLTAKIVPLLARRETVTSARVQEIEDEVRSATGKDSRLLDREAFDRLMDMVTPNIARFVARFMPEDGDRLLDRTWRQPSLPPDEEARILSRFIPSGDEGSRAAANGRAGAAAPPAAEDRDPAAAARAEPRLR